MPEPIANILALVLGAYIAVGALFAVLFVWRGAAKVDAAAGVSGWGFRVMIFPGVVLLWPVMARMWARGDRGLPALAQPQKHRRRHLAMWAMTGPLALAGLALAVWLRAGSPAAPVDGATQPIVRNGGGGVP
ncbi:MAG: hypothetical protein ACKVZJ_11830 [Phycisphaerales bacterium]